MLDLLWQLGILSAVLVFGVKIGLAMGFAGLSKKTAVAIAAGYGAGIILLSYLISGYTDIISKVVYDYNFIIFVVLALIIIYAGFHTIREWKVHGRNNAKATCMAMIAPCPCCFGAVLAAIFMAAPVIGVSSAFLGQYAGVIMGVTIISIYLASDFIVKWFDKPYPLLLGNFMLFVGLYFLASAILIPNISAVSETQTSPLNVPSLLTLFYVVVVVGALIGLGVFLNRKKSTLLEK
ncbi:DUF2162 domain-containing protein [Methanobacterium movens]